MTSQVRDLFRRGTGDETDKWLQMSSTKSDKIAVENKSVTFSLFGLMHLMKCGLAAVILSMRIPKDVFYEKKKSDNSFD